MVPGLHKKVCEVLLVAEEPLTAAEIQGRISGNYRIGSVSARMSELVLRDLVMEVGTRKCTVSDQNVLTYFLTGRPDLPIPKDMKPKRPTKKKIEEMLREINVARDDPDNSHQRNAYYMGVQRALGWVLGQNDTEPGDTLVMK